MLKICFYFSSVDVVVYIWENQYSKNEGVRKWWRWNDCNFLVDKCIGRSTQ